MPGLSAWLFLCPLHTLHSTPTLFLYIISSHFLAQFCSQKSTTKIQMEAVILTKDQYQDILAKIEAINTSISQNHKEPKDSFLDNQEFLQLMNISKRTAQTWRDEGIVAFSQVGGKIYYRMSDIQVMLDKNHKPAFRK